MCVTTPSSNPLLMLPGSAKETESSRRRGPQLLERRTRMAIFHLLADLSIKSLKKSTSSRRARSLTTMIRAPSRRYAWMGFRPSLLRLLSSRWARRTSSNTSCNLISSLRGRRSTSSSLLTCTLKQAHHRGGPEGQGRREEKQSRDLTQMSRCAMIILQMALGTVTKAC